MNISIFGLGYVGCIAAGCLAEMGHKIIGVDIEPIKIDLINRGSATIVEKDIDEIIYRNYAERNLTATLDTSTAVLYSEAAIICVGTPNDNNGHLNMKYIYKVAADIGKAVKGLGRFYTIAIRSTIMPGTTMKIIEIIENESGKKHNVDFAVLLNPEFLREGTAVYDFYNPPFTLIAGESNEAINMMKLVYSRINNEIIITDYGTAEMIKLVNNTFHALKVCFANEIGRICRSIGVDSHSLMDIFIRDTKLNISKAYLKPGFAYGGSCLPKDLRALNSVAHDNYLSTPVISSIDKSNQDHIEHVLDLIISHNKIKIGLYGLSFKAGTDDLRYSPSLEIAERLIGKGYDVTIYDKNVNLTCLMGKNKEYIFKRLPHINRILKEDLENFLKNAELVVVTGYDEEILFYLDEHLKDIEIIDLVRVKQIEGKRSYEGISW